MTPAARALVARPGPPAPWADGAWDLAQRGLALGALVALAPVFAAMWLAVRCTSPGPFLFRQARRGLGGVPFTCFKVRTLTLGSERPTALGVTRADPAITRVGHVLRELKLDELPQLWNVVRGDMRLVGPRPLPLALEDELERSIAGFSRRHEVKPGLTNLAQVAIHDNGVGDDLLPDWRLRSEAERHHAQRRTPAYELVLIALTVLFILRRAARKVRARAAA